MSNLIYFIYTTLYISFVKNEIYQIGQKPQKKPSLLNGCKLSTPSSPMATFPQEQNILKENKQNKKQTTEQINKQQRVFKTLYTIYTIVSENVFKKLKLPIFIAICHMSIGLELRLKHSSAEEWNTGYLLIQTIEVIEDQSINKNR